MNIAILLAGGSGTRFGSDKILEWVNNERRVFEYSLQAFQENNLIDAIVIVCSADNLQEIRQLHLFSDKVNSIISGGSSRFESALLGYDQAKKIGLDLAIFHNLANPGVSQREITQVITAAEKTGAAGVGRKITSTVRREGAGTLPREGLMAMETPQALKSETFELGVRNILDIPTDDLQIAEYAGIIPDIVEADPLNFKITVAADLKLFEQLLLASKRQLVGIGQDSHVFSDTDELILGGLKIPDAPKLLGNSDGDAVLHALTNAVSSALGGGSLAVFSDQMCKDGITDSKEYLLHILSELKAKGGSIINISISIEAGRPKLESYFPAMKQTIAKIANVKPENVGITVTSGEKITEFGKGNGIAVFAAVLVSVAAK